MELVITNSSREVIYTETATMQPEEVSFTEQYSKEDHPFWKIDKHEISLPGIQIGEYQFNITEEIHLQAYDPAAMPGLFFVQQGVMASKLFHENVVHQFQSGRHAILFNPLCAEDTLLKQQSGLSIFMVRFIPDHFLQMAEGGGPLMSQMADSVVANRVDTFLPPGSMAITPKMNAVISEIKNCTYTGGIKKLFLQAKVMELLTLQCAQIEQAQGSSMRPFKLSTADLARIYLARDILIQDILNPPSLTSLARLAGLNEFKLKAGFRTVFATSVFGYLNDHRLELGKQLALKRSKSLTEIAYETGYANIAHFSNAFKKKYGVSPVKMRS